MVNMNTFISLIADWLVIPIVIVASFILLFKVPNKHKLVIYNRLLLAGLTSYFTAKLMSIIYQPTTLRPFEIAGVNPGASYLNNPGFPSDHTLFVWVIVFAVCYVLGRSWTTFGLALAAIVVGIGRVLALVHTPIDVAGGFFAAIVGTVWYITRFAKEDRLNLQKLKK